MLCPVYNDEDDILIIIFISIIIIIFAKSDHFTAPLLSYAITLAWRHNRCLINSVVCDLIPT
jgi:hypothetical protein